MASETQLTALQLSVLDRYRTLNQALRSLDDKIKELNKSKQESKTDLDKHNIKAGSEDILKQMREVEIKIGLVGTLLKASVYSLILQRNERQEAE